MKRGSAPAARRVPLCSGLVHKGLTVRTFFLRRIDLVGADADGVQGAVVGASRMVGAVFDGALNGFVCIAEFHEKYLLLLAVVQRRAELICSICRCVQKIRNRI